MGKIIQQQVFVFALLIDKYIGKRRLPNAHIVEG